MKEKIGLWILLSLGSFIYHYGKSMLADKDFEWEQLFNASYFMGVGIIACYLT